MQELQRPVHDLPLAVSGLQSYRCKGRYDQWIMIGAKDDADAWLEAARSTDDAHDMQRWDEAAQEYRPIGACVALGYRIDCKQGYVLTDEHGNITRDCVGRDYRRTPDPSWRIAGIATRFNARWLVSLAAAADGANIGQGWIHDVDHGTARMWANPSYRRAVRVTRIELGAGSRPA